MTIQKIKEFGNFVLFHEESKSWIYALENSLYSLNNNGIVKIYEYKNN